jgi:hypothetical protein
MPEETKTAQNKKKGGGEKKVIIGVSLAGVAVVIGVVAFLLLHKPQEEEDNKREVISPASVDQVIDEIQSTSRADVPQSFIVTQNSEWIFPTWDSPSTNAYVENDNNNETPVYFDLIMDDAEDPIYSSPVLEQGVSFTGFALDKEVPAGTYSCTVVYHLVDEEQNTLTTSRIGTTIIIQE